MESHKEPLSCLRLSHAEEAYVSLWIFIYWSDYRPAFIVLHRCRGLSACRRAWRPTDPFLSDCLSRTELFEVRANGAKSIRYLCLLPPSERGTTKFKISKLYHRLAGTRASRHPARLTPPKVQEQSPSRIRLPKPWPPTIPRPLTELPIWQWTFKCCPLNDVWRH